ncbi:MAG: hypothetical protein E7516_02370 [Ruminococcaceae bacterium]|nr:hypothetical protein [Oscillospiraceae bacterium]
MKSREEYTASIYAKRDAILKKRKKAAGGIAAALCIAVSFCTAAAVMPKMMKKTSHKETPAVETTAFNTENLENTEGEILVTFVESYIKPKPEYSEEAMGAENEQGENFIVDAEGEPENRIEKEEWADKQFANHVTKAVTEIALETVVGEDALHEPAVTKKPSSLGKYTNDEILEAAENCLTDEEKKAVEGVEPMVTVTRTKGGEESYGIMYMVGDTKIKIILNAENLEFVDKSGGIISEGTTAALPYMTTPAYNPVN